MVFLLTLMVIVGQKYFLKISWWHIGHFEKTSNLIYKQVIVTLDYFDNSRQKVFLGDFIINEAKLTFHARLNKLNSISKIIIKDKLFNFILSRMRSSFILRSVSSTEDISKSQLNTSKSKNLWSFGKDSRFKRPIV